MPGITTIILTGGKATRMRPLSEDICKSMIPFMGKPLIHYLVTALRSHGFTDLVFTSAGRKEEIREYLGDGTELGVQIRFPKMSAWRGTAGTAKDLIADLDSAVSDTVMIIYGDSLLRADYGRMLAFHRGKAASATILYHCPRFESFLYAYQDKAYEDLVDRTNYGVLDVNADGEVMRCEEKPVISKIPQIFHRPVANATVYILDKSIWSLVPSDRDSDFPRDIFPVLVKSSFPCFGFDIGGGYRLDIGTLKQYYAAQMAALDGRLDFDCTQPCLRDHVWVGEDVALFSADTLSAPVLIADNSRIMPGARVSRSVIGCHVTIGSGSSVQNSLVLDDTVIGENVRIEDSIIGMNCTISDNVVVPRRTVLGNDCTLGGFNLTMTESEFQGLLGDEVTVVD